MRPVAATDGGRSRCWSHSPPCCSPWRCWLEARRDFGAGLLAERPGRAGAPPRYATPLGLALRLQRGPIIGWTIAVVLGALLIGSVVKAMTALLSDAGSGAAAILRGTGVTRCSRCWPGMIALISRDLRHPDHDVPAFRRGQRDHRAAAGRRAVPVAVGAERLLIPAVWSAVLLAVGGWLIGAVYGARSVTRRRVGARRRGSGVLAGGHGARRARRAAVRLRAARGDPDDLGRHGSHVVHHAIGEVHLPDWLLDVMPFSATPYLPLEQMTLDAAGDHDARRRGARLDRPRPVHPAGRPAGVR